MIKLPEKNGKAIHSNRQDGFRALSQLEELWLIFPFGNRYFDFGLDRTFPQRYFVRADRKRYRGAVGGTNNSAVKDDICSGRRR